MEHPFQETFRPATFGDATQYERSVGDANYSYIVDHAKGDLQHGYKQAVYKSALQKSAEIDMVRRVGLDHLLQAAYERGLADGAAQAHMILCPQEVIERARMAAIQAAVNALPSVSHTTQSGEEEDK